MKYTIAVGLTILLSACIISCKKDNADTIAARWNIVNDSTFLEGNGILEGSSSNYKGVATDYFDFSPDGYLYEQEGMFSDTAKYSLMSNNQVKFVYYAFNGINFGAAGLTKGIYTITTLTEHNLTLVLSGLTPEGKQFEIINLKR